MQSPVELNQDSYGVLLVSAQIDRWQHNQVFANEIAAAFNARGVRMKQVDYLKDVRLLSQCYVDQHCKFFVCFNGFGSELSLASGLHLVSAFEHYRKPLLDLMHDCPVHETMDHQVDSTSDSRKLFLTDYNYAFLARMLGIRNTRFVPSITFPVALGERPLKRFEDRTIDVLLPIGVSNADEVKGRHSFAGTYKDRVYKQVFESVVDVAVADLRVDPLIETMVALQAIHSSVNFANREITFLISSILDYVKFKRREELIDAVKHLPITLVTDRELSPDLAGTELRVAPNSSFAGLLETMTNSRTVICPLPHHTGFHERAMGAFSAGAYVISAPNEVLETNFGHDREMHVYRNVSELASTLEAVIAGTKDLEPVAQAGRARAEERFSPNNLVGAMLTTLALDAA
ncbi:MAG: glycosyltransferase [Polaromonas sp.]|nr:glycosyltransferase [Polaromonas sp.]